MVKVFIDWQSILYTNMTAFHYPDLNLMVKKLEKF